MSRWGSQGQTEGTFQKGVPASPHAWVEVLCTSHGDNLFLGGLCGRQHEKDKGMAVRKFFLQVENPKSPQMWVKQHLSAATLCGFLPERAVNFKGSLKMGKLIKLFFFPVYYLYKPSPAEFFTISETGRELFPSQGRCTSHAASHECVLYSQIVTKCFGWKLPACGMSWLPVMPVYCSLEMPYNSQHE